MAMQIRRRIGTAGAPALGDLEVGQLSYNDPAGGTGATTDALYISNGAAVRTLVSATRQVELFGDQPGISGHKTFAGQLTLNGTVQTGANDAATRQWVLNEVASMQLFMDTWDAVANVPDLVAAAAVPPANGAYWLASVGATALQITGHAIPGLTTAVNAGDTIMWRGPPTNAFERIAGGGLTQAEADARYLQLVAGGTVSGVTQFSATLNVGSPANQAATKGYVDTAIGTTIQEPTGTAGEVFGREIGTPNAWAGVLPLAGGTLTETSNGGVGLIIINDAGTDNALTIHESTTGGMGLWVENTGQPYAAALITNEAGAGGMALSIQNLTTAANAVALSIEHISPANGVDINSTGTGIPFTVRNAASTRFSVLANGVVTVGTPTGGTPPTTPGNINLSGGYYANGASIIDDGTY